MNDTGKQALVDKMADTSTSSVRSGFKSASVRAKLIVAYSSVFVVVLLLTTGALYLLTKRIIERDIESELNNSTTAILNMANASANVAIRNHLQVIAHKNKEVVTGLYQSVLTGELEEAEAKRQATQILLRQHIGDTGYIYCLDSKGVVRVHPKPSLVGQDISNYSFVQQQIEDKEGYLNYEWKNPDDTEKRPKTMFMTYFEPWDWIVSVTSYRSEFKDLISADDFYESVMDLKFGETGYSYVIDMKGTLIIHPAQPNVNIYDSQDSEGRYFIRQMIQQKSGRIIYPWKNPGEIKARNKLVIFNHLPEFGIIVASSSYLDEFYQPLKVVRWTILVSSVVAMLLLMSLAMWLGNTISRPLSRAAKRFQSAEEGDFSVRINIESMDEIGRMANSFNAFMERLENYKNELHDLNENLENRVQARTAELEKAMEEVKTLSGLLPICSSCKKIREDTGYWTQIESYLHKHSDAELSHGLCPDCVKKLYPDFYEEAAADDKPDGS